MSILKPTVESIQFKNVMSDEELKLKIVKKAQTQFPILLKLRTNVPDSVDVRPGFGIIETKNGLKDFTCVLRPSNELPFDGKMKICYLDALEPIIFKPQQTRAEFNGIYEGLVKKGCQEKFLYVSVKRNSATQKQQKISKKNQAFNQNKNKDTIIKNPIQNNVIVREQKSAITNLQNNHIKYQKKVPSEKTFKNQQIKQTNKIDVDNVFFSSQFQLTQNIYENKQKLLPTTIPLEIKTETNVDKKKQNKSVQLQIRKETKIQVTIVKLILLALIMFLFGLFTGKQFFSVESYEM